MDSQPLVLYRRNCGNPDCPRWLWLCDRCDRLCRYCSEACRRQARTVRHRIANRRYQDSARGRRSHSVRQGRYRARQRSQKKIVTDRDCLEGVSGSMLEPCRPFRLPSPAAAPRCHRCGRLGVVATPTAEGTAREAANMSEPSIAAPPSPRQYVNQLLTWYEQLPDTPAQARAVDREQAHRLFARAVPAETVESALLLASLRRLTRDQTRGALPRIRSLAYFLPVVEELLAEPVKPGYAEYLRHKLQVLASRRRI